MSFVHANPLHSSNSFGANVILRQCCAGSGVYGTLRLYPELARGWKRMEFWI